MTTLIYVGSGYVALIALYGWKAAVAAVLHVGVMIAARPPPMRRR